MTIEYRNNKMTLSNKNEKNKKINNFCRHSKNSTNIHKKNSIN